MFQTVRSILKASKRKLKVLALKAKMEAAYEKIIGPINPKDPPQSFSLNISVLKWLGMWTLETESHRLQKLYSVYSIALRVFFLYIFMATQINFFLNAENLADVGESFNFLTHVALCYKLENFYRNRHRIQKVLRRLGGPIFRPKNSEESQCIKLAMTHCFGFSFWFLSILQPAALIHAIEPFLKDVRKFPIAARFPFNTDSSLAFGLTLVYQIVGVYLNAAFNIASDGVASGMMAHLNGQVKRLGVQLEKIGYDELKIDDDQEDDKDLDEEMAEISARVRKSKAERGVYYSEWVKCILFHKSILRLTEEIEDIFKRPIYAQFVCSCGILCMNCFMILKNAQETATMVKNLSYLSGALTQIVIFCWIGSELIHSSSQLSTQAYFSNSHVFDPATKKVMLIFMARTYKDIVLEAGVLFRVALSLPSFKAIADLSYSYLNIMRDMDSK